MTPTLPLKGLVVGLANEQSIAWGCIEAFHNIGAELAVTYLNDKTRKYTEPLMDRIKAPIYAPLDVTDKTQMESLFTQIRDKWGQLDFVLHSIAYAPKEDLQGRVTDSSREGYMLAMELGYTIVD